MKKFKQFAEDHPGVVIASGVYLTGVVTTAVIATVLTRGMAGSVVKKLASRPIYVVVPEQLVEVIKSSAA